MRLATITLLTTGLMAGPSLAHAHDGPVDKYGGHVEQPLGVYHLHRNTDIIPNPNPAAAAATWNTQPTSLEPTLPAPIYAPTQYVGPSSSNYSYSYSNYAAPYTAPVQSYPISGYSTYVAPALQQQQQYSFSPAPTKSRYGDAPSHNSFAPAYTPYPYGYR